MTNSDFAARYATVVCAQIGVLSLVTLASVAAMAQEGLPNACPVDGCSVTIVAVSKAGNELQVTLEANFTPDVSKNHVHVWWGELYTVEQVSNDAEPTYGVKQGDWHPTADFPTYVTQSAASVSARNAAHTLCVSPADRNHDILDPQVYNCVDVAGHL